MRELGATAVDESGFCECQFDALVGPTHNYAGLAYGNVASERHRAQASNPKLAARQGLEKMWQVASWGIPQAVLPPLVRPQTAWLRHLGFAGTNLDVIRQAARSEPALLAAAYSASSMWAANAATVSPSPDTADGRVHFTPANLASSLHRSLESHDMLPVLRAIFSSEAFFCVHPTLPGVVALTDEGAANHTRLVSEWHQAGIEWFVFGRNALNSQAPHSQRYPARQTLQASQAVARRHGLSAERTCFSQQNPVAIDAGVFHNDVICVGHRGLVLIHQEALVEQASALEALRNLYERLYHRSLLVVEIPSTRLSLDDAVKSYLFNSQLVTTSEGKTVLLCPQECEAVPAAHATLSGLMAGEFTQGRSPIDALKVLDLRQSMNNGGGPACLRLRVLLNREQRKAVRGRVWLDQSLYSDLQSWIERHYPERIEPQDLSDLDLAVRSWEALRELQQIMELPLGNCDAPW